MSKINYVTGDATQPQGEGKKIICHICNDIGAWGAGFVLALSNKWRLPEDHYRARQSYPLGHADVISVDISEGMENEILVANMIGQHRIGMSSDGTPPIRYQAVAEALMKVNKIANNIGATLHMPRIGCGLAGGDWQMIEKILKAVVSVDVTVYDLP